MPARTPPKLTYRPPTTMVALAWVTLHGTDQGDREVAALNLAALVLEAAEAVPAPRLDGAVEQGVDGALACGPGGGVVDERQGPAVDDLALCECGHIAHWHGDFGLGVCEHDEDCGCGSFVEETS